MAIKYEFPCYPGDDVWYIDSVGSKYWCRPDKVEMVGFTTRSIRIKLRGHKEPKVSNITFGTTTIAVSEIAAITFKEN